jgi:putative ABC transport system substrate-binding protein
VNRRLAVQAFTFTFASFIAVVGPPRAQAADQVQSVVRVGFVSPQSPSTATPGVRAFWERLRELGYIEGQNLAIEARWAEGRIDRLPALMNEVIATRIDVLVTYSTPGAVAAKDATSTTPIVVAVMGDPVGTGLVASLARPGGNVTGLSLGWGEGMEGKWLEGLQELVPRLSIVGVVGNPDNPLIQEQMKELETIAPMRGLKALLFKVREPAALDRAFEQAGRKTQAILVLADPLTATHGPRITALAAKYRLPAMYSLRDFVDGGGLVAYAPNMKTMFLRAAEYVDKILKGARPADLPIEQPTHFELVVNVKTAESLGLMIPQSMLQRADEIIK